MKYVRKLEIMYDYGEDEEFEDSCFLGYYSSEEKARQMIGYFRNKADYSKYSEDCFVIDKIEIDRKRWSEGFISYDDM
ncbi:MAG: hypothetical protein LIO87_07465 [Eubacterium sp.]|nr:hypothetical protein [Eubacterium sp.]